MKVVCAAGTNVGIKQTTMAPHRNSIGTSVCFTVHLAGAAIVDGSPRKHNVQSTCLKWPREDRASYAFTLRPRAVGQIIVIELPDVRNLNVNRP